MTTEYKIIDSPVGQLTLVAQGSSLVAILWQVERPNRVRLGVLTPAPGGSPASLAIEAAERQLAEYFAGQRKRFALPLAFNGTEFQRKVWQALLTIPFGETRTYAQIARQIGHPTAVRAVGAANGRNPISIVAPCHRVIGASGELTGFAGGLAAKALLLGVERGQGTVQGSFEFAAGLP
ncbi:methylated-DNA--[protein]-cysteine S-methyltransferase [Pseudomonas sp. HR96]|uniref:methylated-DNA--[protein]-cysteine S-methyltransferase n=1 Tax=Pseudomonas sp. HR96 TaxID=1027966 RepID=UPI002A75F06C|nr:methylated-DNA--[protein]-cysteine S-methyltransferase [Pseudomonas sp. HR96]WPO98231.1 methylated-DNA--[protein]-cysteine S-methyltransferase [Pseudomonas sp. HR96]